MKRKKVDIKKIVKKKIEERHDKHVFLESKGKKSNPKTVLSERTTRRTNNNNKITERTRARISGINNKNVYIKNENVKYDAVIIIPSYNRYSKVKSLLKQIHEQKTKYNFKIVLLNDGSTDLKYRVLIKMFPDMVYLENETNYNKRGYWKTINKLFSVVKNNSAHTVIQIDDDYILCDNYLDILIDKFFDLKKIDNNYIGISFHRDREVYPSQWGSGDRIDGGTLFDYSFIGSINFRIDEIFESRWKHNKELSSGVWPQINTKIVKMKKTVHRTEYSLVKHNGNEDSKMNKILRDKLPIFTWEFIDDK